MDIAVDLDRPIEDNLAVIAETTGRDIGELTVVMLDRDRHEPVKRRIREAGAWLQLIADGDVEGSIVAAWEDRPGST